MALGLGSTTDLNIKIDATTASAEAGLARLTRSTMAYETSLRRAQLAQAQLDKELEMQAAAKYAAQTRALEQAGRGLLAFGGVAAVGLGLSAKAAIDWETAWTGVRKTVSGSPAELAAVEKGLRDLATTLPTSHAEIAAVAEAAGQLGVRTGDIVSFTKTMIDLGQTTNLTAEDAATAMARFANIMQTPTDQVDRLGASLVALGNDGASTEAEILTMGNRIAAAGKLVGLTEGEVLGLANAMSSLGIEAEAGGSAISLTLRQISSAVAEGGDGLEEFARVSGMSADEFGRLFSTDAAAATEAFVRGLNRIKKSGGDVNATLGGLGITGLRQVDTLLRLSGNTKLLAESLDLGNRAYKENTALLEEANKRYETTASKLQVAKNQVVDFGISIGDRLLPVLGQTVGVLSDLLGWLDRLPDPMKDMIAIGGVAAAAVGLFGGAALTAVAKFRTMRTELATSAEALSQMDKRAALARGGALALAAALPILTSAIGGTSKEVDDMTAILTGAATGFAITGGPWGAAIGALVGLTTTLTGGSNSAAEAQQRLEANISAVSVTLNEQTGAITRNTSAWVNEKLAADDFVGAGESAFDAAENLGISLSTVKQAAMGNETALKAVADRMNELGGIKGADDLGNWNKNTGDILILNEALHMTNRSIKGAQEQARQSRDANQDLGTSYKSTGTQAEDAAQAIRALARAEREAAEAAIQNKRDQLALISTMQSAREEARKGKRTLDETTKAGQDNWAALLDLADQWESSTNKVRNADGAYKDVRRTFIEVAREMGASERKAKSLADRFLSVPPAAQKATQAGKQMAVDIGRALRGIEDEPVKVTLTAQANKVMNQLSRYGFEQGGPVPGVDIGRDTIPAMLRPGEHVLTVDDVKKMGGQESVYAMRRMVQRGEFAKRGDLTPFATGGAVLKPTMRLQGLDMAAGRIDTFFDTVVDGVAQALSAALSKKLTTFTAGGFLGPAGRLTPPQIVRGQNFAKAQAGKPYVWGGVGPGGYDCSGVQSATLNAALGRYPYSRVGSTGTAPWPGSSPGVGRYTMGWFTGNPGHMSGNIGFNVESAGGVGVRIGAGARSPLDSMFNGVMHYDTGGPLYPGLTMAVNNTGMVERVGFAGGGEVKASGSHLQGVGDKPLTDKQINEVLRELRDRFGRRSPIVDAIERWLGHIKRAEFTQRALNHRIGEILRGRSNPLLRQFDVGPKQSRSETRSEIRELLRGLKELLGKDAPIIQRIERMGDRLVELQRRQDKAQRAYDKATDKYDRIVSAQKEFAATVRSAFTHDAFGGDITTFSSSLLQLQADANDAAKATRQFRKLGRMGLDDPIIKQLAASGNTALIQSLAGSTPQQIKQFEQAFKRRQRELKQLGLVTSGQVFGDERHAQMQVVRRTHHVLNRLDRRLGHLENAVERGAERGVRRGMRDREHHQRRKRRAKAVR